jgi:NADPH-dependent ferric siderophore reductase
MSAPLGRRPRRTTTAVVRSVSLPTPHLARVVVGGEGLASFTVGEFADHYIKLFFPLDGVDYPEPFSMQHVRETMPREQWPRVRTYTVRDWDPQRLELTFDVVLHGDVGLAGPWASRVQPGEIVHFGGPGGGYLPSSDVDWHLLAGDESALPAITVALRQLPAGALAHVLVEVAGPEDEQPLPTAADARIRWLHRDGGRPGEPLVRAVADLAFPAGAVQAFVHGEAGMVKELRRQLFVERGVPRAGHSLSGYWRLGQDEDSWEATKREWNAAVVAEQDGPD